FLADEFQKLRVGLQSHFDIDCPWPRIRLRIVDRHLYVHVSEIAAAEAFDQMETIGSRMAGSRPPIADGPQCCPDNGHASVNYFNESMCLRRHLGNFRSGFSVFFPTIIGDKWSALTHTVWKMQDRT